MKPDIHHRFKQRLTGSFRALLCVAGLVGATAEATLASPDPAPNQVTVGRWLTPSTAGGSDLDLGFSRPTWELGYARWQGSWGGMVNATIFGQTAVPFSGTPYFPSGAVLADAQARYRWDFDRLTLEGDAGYRFFSTHQVGLATLAAKATVPATEHVALEAQMLAGANAYGAYSFDQRIALALHWAPVNLSLGYRRLVLQCGCDPAEPAAVLGGPAAELSLAF